jgi:hypothetical protein
MSIGTELSDDEYIVLSNVYRKSGVMPDERVAAQLVSRGLITENWNLTTDGEKAYLANHGRKIRPVKRNFIGQR